MCSISNNIKVYEAEKKLCRNVFTTFANITFFTLIKQIERDPFEITRPMYLLTILYPLRRHKFFFFYPRDVTNFVRLLLLFTSDMPELAFAVLCVCEPYISKLVGFGILTIYGPNYPLYSSFEKNPISTPVLSRVM